MRTLPGSLHLALLAGTALVSPLAQAQTMPANNAAPVLDRVVAGGITIQQDAATTQVTQTQQRGVVDWRSFDVGRDHAVRFNQPSTSAATLNRVTGPDPSVIAGRISANGQIAIVNRSGVVFAQGAQVEAAGLIASAAGITNENFLAGGPRLTFDQPAHAGARVENAGTITIREAGLAGLVAPQVVNRGAIVAHMGRVALGGAETAIIDLHGDGLVSLEVTRPVSRAPADGGALVANVGTIEATGGTVLLTAQAADGIVQNLVRAGGRIAAGTDAATGRTGQVALRGTGGAIIIEGEVSAVGAASGTRGGSVTAIADRVLVAGTGRVDASGAAGGGSVGIGAEGRPGTPRIAQRAGTAPGAVVRADATENGPGGTIRIDSLIYTAHAGTASARGGPGGGDGGLIEVSGAQGLRISGAADISAPAGQAGTVLVDPATIDIVASGSGNVPAITGDILQGDPPLNALIEAPMIDSFPGNLRLEATTTITVSEAVNKPTGNLVLATSSSGNITVNAPITLGGGDLTLAAGDALVLNANLAVPATNTVTLTAGNNGIQQFAGGVTAGTLFAQVNSGGPLSMGGPNSVGTLSSFSTIGASTVVLFRNQTSLDITGPVGSSSNTATRIEVTGDLTVNGTVRGGGPGVASGTPLVALLATGDIEIGAAGIVQGSGGAATGDLTLTAGWSGTGDAPNLAAPGQLRLLGQVIGPTLGGAPSSVLRLGAGTGGIVQTSGSVTVQSLEIQSGGSALLNAPTASTPNQVGTLLTSNVTGDLRLNTSTTSAYGTFGLVLDGTQTVSGTMRLEPGTFGNVTQPATGVIDAARFEVEAGSVTLDGANRIDVLADSPVFNSLNVRNAQALTVQGTVGGTVSSSANILVDTGDLTIDGTVQAIFGAVFTATAGNVIVTPAGRIETSDDTRLRAGGDIVVNGLVQLQSGQLEILADDSVTLGATGSVEFGQFDSARIFAAYDGSTNTSDPTRPGGMTLAGSIGNGTVTVGNITVGAGTGGIVQTGGSIVANTLTVAVSGAGAVFDRGGQTGGTPNSVNTISAAAIPGDLVLDNGSTTILPGTDLTAANIGFRTSGVIDGHGTLLVAPTGRITLRAGTVLARNYQLIDGAVVEIAPDSAVPMIVGGPAGPGFRVIAADLSQIIATDTLRLGGTTFGGVLDITAASVQFVAPLAVANRLDVRSLGTIGQDPGADIAAPRFAGRAGAATVLTNPGNAIDIVEDFSALGPFTLLTSGALGIAAHLDGHGQAVDLTAVTGGITSSGPGRISADTLTLDATGPIALTGPNAVGFLGPVTTNGAGGFAFANAAPGLTVPGGVLVDASGAVVITQAGGPLTVDGTVRGASVSLTGDTSLAVNGFSAIAFAGGLLLDAPAVTVNGLLSATGNIVVTAPSSATLGGQAVGSGLSVTSPGVAFTGLNAAGTPVTIDLGAAGTTSGAVSALSLLVIGGSGATLAGSIAGVTTGAAAAIGRRANPQGVLYGDPPPDAQLFTFNGCQLATVLCLPLPPPPPPPPQPPLPPSPGVVFGPLPTLLADNPQPLLDNLDPALDATSIERLLPDVPAIVARLPRDRSEEDSLAPADIRAEDY